ncbi:hypothetical protein [Alteriqipengyuania sp.]|uniref:hypothetical protein n=1 Tax=Alteriqipengyuania sp. TaxID=2800692 RepID=UPI0032190C54
MTHTDYTTSASELLFAFGERLLADHQDLEVRLQLAKRPGLVSLMAACMKGDWNTEEAIIAKVGQFGGPYYDREVPLLLEIHRSPLARPQLWVRDELGRYQLTEMARG